MAKKTGLGKGLEALFINSDLNIEEQNEGEKITNLKIIDIEPNKEQPRRIFNEEGLNELSESIKRYGVIQPIIVSKQGDYFQIVAGERRWRAAKKAGLQEIPAIIKDYDDQKNKEIALIENIQREDLNPIEKAIGIRKLMDDYQLTQQNVADILGKARSSIANTVRLLNLDERVMELALKGKLTEAHCKVLLSIDDNDKQYQAALSIIESGDNVRQATKKTKIKSKMSKDEAKKYDAIYRDIENKFQGFFGTKVKLDPGKRKVKIIIEYNNNDDLERIIDLLKGDRAYGDNKRYNAV